MTFTKVALAGASGQLGRYLLHHLRESMTPKFDITVLIRAETTKGLLDQVRDSEIKICKVDYNDHHQLVKALTGIDVILSALNSVPAIETDILLAKAGNEAGVRRIFPSEYSIDMLHPASIQLMGPSHPRVQHAQTFVAIGNDPAYKISFTTIVSCMFIDLAMKGHHGNYDMKNKCATLFDGGAVPATGCSVDFIAASIVATLKMPEASTWNKRIRIAEVEYTGQAILRALEEATRTQFEVVSVSSTTIAKRLEIAKEKALIKETFVLPVVLLNFAAVDGQAMTYGAGMLKEGLEWDAGGLLIQKRQNLTQIAREVVR